MSRVLWLSPWLRSLARVQVEALQRRGHEILLVTSDQHPESDAARAYELVLTPSPKQASSWPQFAAAQRRVRRFGADVAVTELVRDPRWLAFTRGVPRVAAVHDDRPHDEQEQRPRWERSLFDRRTRSSAAVVAFSRFVQEATGATQLVPLTSDLDPERVPAEAAAADERRDFVLAGRLNAYKNVPVTLAAWQRHTAGPGWRGDDLLLIGAGELPTLPPHVVHLDGAFRYRAALPLLHRAKASVAHYRRASQSGVQVLAMQLGVVPVVSPVGALPDFQPPGESPVGIDDVAALAARFDQLAEPAAAAARGAAARAHYEQNFAVDLAAARWEDVFAAVSAARPARASG